MPKKVRNIEKLALVRAEIMKAVKATPIRKITYGNLGALTQTGPRGPGKPLLDHIADEELQAGRPDITVIVVRSDTRYPGQIDRKATRYPTSDDKRRAYEKMQAVIDKHNPKAANPFG